VKVIRQNPKQSARLLNELEFVNGKIIANVWHQDVLLVINPETGECEDEYNLSALWPKNARNREGANVLNGVSVSGEDGVLYVTGKFWRKMFQLKLK
jgi:glutamine cyclotransferase